MEIAMIKTEKESSAMKNPMTFSDLQAEAYACLLCLCM